jgi:hypothetical protein
MRTIILAEEKAELVSYGYRRAQVAQWTPGHIRVALARCRAEEAEDKAHADATATEGTEPPASADPLALHVDAAARAGGTDTPADEPHVGTNTTELKTPSDDSNPPVDDEHLDGGEPIERTDINPKAQSAPAETWAKATSELREINKRQGPRPTPQSVIEAVLVSVRARGLAALREPASVERLSRCDSVAKAEINSRIAKIEAAGLLKGDRDA